ncbi:integrator complex subunit 6-like [Vicugna pacos]|uniref:Integrator complex subunit 6-like n=1 Tax=Vicugna pacos TaxID=30538 RepID=A0ABM5CTR0_VICPA
MPPELPVLTCGFSDPPSHSGGYVQKHLLSNRAGMDETGLKQALKPQVPMTFALWCYPHHITGQKSGHRSQPVEGARGSAGGSGLRALGGWPRGSRGGSLSRLQRLQCPVARGGCRQQLWPAASLEPSRAVEHQLVEVMSDEAEEFAVGPENQMELCGEPESPSLSEEKPGMGLLPMKQDEEGESHSGALSMSGEDTATVTHDVHEEKTENNQTPPNGFLPKSAAPELMNMAADDLPPKQFDSVSDDFTSLSKDDLTDKPGSNTVERGTQTCSVSVGDSKATVMSSTGTVPNTLQISPAMAQKINDDIKYQLMKEVRRFGRKYERIFTLLEGVQGPLEVKKQFVEFTIKEARRFKRGVLIQQLEKFLEKVESDRLGNGVNHKKNR